MDKTLISKIVTTDAAADIGKYTKDGADLDYTLVVQLYDQYTGEPSGTEQYSITAVWLDEEIDKAQKVLDDLKALKVVVTDEKVPVLADYTVIEAPIEPIEPPAEEPTEPPAEEPTGPPAGE